MEKDFRYKMEHMGDYFVGMVEKVASASRSSAKGVILTYDIRQLRRRKEALIKDIGARVAQVSKEDPSFAQDETIRGLLERLNETEKRLSEYVEERKNLLSPARDSCSSGSTTSDSPQNA